MYVILDIETTGGKFNEEGVTEIAIYRYDGHTIVDQFISLVNPEKPIQEFVVKLTGINNKMLKKTHRLACVRNSPKRIHTHAGPSIRLSSFVQRPELNIYV